MPRQIPLEIHRPPRIAKTGAILRDSREVNRAAPGRSIPSISAVPKLACATGARVGRDRRVVNFGAAWERDDGPVRGCVDDRGIVRDVEGREDLESTPKTSVKRSCKSAEPDGHVLNDRIILRTARDVRTEHRPGPRLRQASLKVYRHGERPCELSEDHLLAGFSGDALGKEGSRRSRVEVREEAVDSGFAEFRQSDS